MWTPNFHFFCLKKGEKEKEKKYFDKMLSTHKSIVLTRLLCIYFNIWKQVIEVYCI